MTQSMRYKENAPFSGRALDALERWYWVFGQISPLNGTARCRVYGELSEVKVKQAIEGVQRRHPLLNVRVVADENGCNPKFELLDNPEIAVRWEKPTENDNDEYWIESIKANELNRPFDTASEPLMRLRIIDYGDSFDIILIASHVIIDATCIMSLLKEILLYAEGEAHDLDALPMMPSFSDRFPAEYNGFIAFLKTLYLQIKIEIFGFIRRPHQLEVEKKIEFNQRRTDFVHKELTKEQTASLLAACKNNKASVHAALCTALMKATVDDIKERNGEKEGITLGIGSPVNLRKDMVPPAGEAELGIFVATFLTFAENVDGREFWEIARKFRADMQIQSRSGEPFSIMNFVRRTMPKSVAKAKGYMKLLDGKGPGNLCISNLGHYEFPEKIGSLKVSDAQFIAETSVTGTWVSTANTSHGQLFWNFSYTKQMISQNRAERLADSCIKILLAQLD